MPKREKDEGFSLSDFDENVSTNVEEQPEEVQVSEDADSEEIPTDVEEPVQVESEKVIFVPFEDFEGRINQNVYTYRKDIPVECTRAQANQWLEAKKGYVK